MTFKKLIIGIGSLAVIALGAVGYNHFKPVTSLGDGNISALEQWKTDGTNITQRTDSKPVKITGLSDGCASIVSGVIGSIPCGGSSSGGVGISATTTITQASHGFTAGQWVGLTGSTTKQYALANAIPGGAFQGVGLVQSVIDTNHFVLQTAGDFTDTNLIPGMAYYLSASSTLAQGTTVGYPPTTAGLISAPVAYANSTTSASIQIGRPSIVPTITTISGINVGNDMIGSTYYATSSVVADAAIIVKNLGSNRVRIALASFNNPIGIYNTRQLALYYKSLGYYVSYGVTGRTGGQNATTYAAWLAQVPAEALWASNNGINMFFIGNEEDNDADLGQMGTINGDQVRFDVMGLSSTLKSAYPNMRIVYSTAQGTVISWHSEGYPSFGALDNLGFNMYDTQASFPANIAFFISQIGSKYFVTEWASNHPYYDMVHSAPFYTDTQYASDLASRASVLNQYGLEAYFFSLRYGGNTLISGNWNILLNTGVFLPGAVSAFGGGLGNAVRNTPIITQDNNPIFLNTVKSAYIVCDITNCNYFAPEFGSFKIDMGTKNISFTHGTTTSTMAGGFNLTGGGCYAINGTCVSGSGGGGGGGGGYGVGTFSTTTSTVSGRLINYPNNTTDIVVIGASATTTAPIYFDPNLSFAKFTNASSTLFTATKLYGAQIFSTGTATSSITNLGWGVDPTLLTGSDIGGKVNTALALLGTGKQTGQRVLIPQGDFSFSTMIGDNILGINAIIQGVGPGTILRWTGTGTSTMISSGIQGGINEHVTGGGIRDLRLIGNNTSTAGLHQVGIAVTGVTPAPPSNNDGSDGTVLDGLTIEGFGQGVVTGKNVYHLHISNSTIRNNGQNWYSAPADNSGESMDFTNVFMIDNAGSNASNCFYMANFSAAEVLYNGGSIDSCQVYVGMQNNFTMIGTNMENPDPAYPAYAYIVGGDSGYTNTNIIGGMFINDQGYTIPTLFNMAGGNLNLEGVTLFKQGGVVTNLVTTTGGNVTWTNLNNTGGFATNMMSGVTGMTKTGTNGTYTLTSLATPTGTFLAADSRGNIIATTTPSVTGGALSGVVNTAGTVSTFGSFTSSTLTTAITDETGTGSIVLNTSPFITTPIFTTNIRTPLVIGGTSVNSTLTLQSTSGVGSSDKIIFQTGSQVTRGVITTGGFWGLATSTPSQVLDVNGSINIEGSANGIIMHDTATSACYLVQVTNGAFATTTHACQ